MMNLRRMVFWNPVIRFILLNSLKFNIIALTVLTNYNDTTNVNLALAICIIVFFFGISYGFSHILRKNKYSLAEEESSKKFGTLYKGSCLADYAERPQRRPKILTWITPIFFILRRIAFASITVLLIEEPFLQICAN